MRIVFYLTHDSVHMAIHALQTGVHRLYVYMLLFQCIICFIKTNFVPYTSYISITILWSHLCYKQ